MPTPAPDRRRRILSAAPAVLLGAALVTLWSIVRFGALSSVVAWYLLQGALPVVGLILSAAALIVGVARRKITPLLVLTFLLGAVAIWPAGWSRGFFALPFPRDFAKTGPSATIVAPAGVPLRVLWGGDAFEGNYHALAPDQRWAYDLAVDPVFVKSDKLEDFGCFGVDVLSPATGQVVTALDGLNDEIPGQRSEFIRHAGGNHVAIKLPQGTFLFIGHLQKGSVLVREGEPIQQGQPLGKCGNSGSSDEPHIHIHHQRQDPSTQPFGFAEGLPLFFEHPSGAALMPPGGVRFDENGNRHPLGTTLEGQRVDAGTGGGAPDAG